MAGPLDFLQGIGSGISGAEQSAQNTVGGWLKGLLPSQPAQPQNPPLTAPSVSSTPLAGMLPTGGARVSGDLGTPVKPNVTGQGLGFALQHPGDFAAETGLTQAARAVPQVLQATGAQAQGTAQQDVANLISGRPETQGGPTSSAAQRVGKLVTNPIGYASDIVNAGIMNPTEMVAAGPEMWMSLDPNSPGNKLLRQVHKATTGQDMPPTTIELQDQAKSLTQEGQKLASVKAALTPQSDQAQIDAYNNQLNAYNAKVQSYKDQYTKSQDFWQNDPLMKTLHIASTIMTLPLQFEVGARMFIPQLFSDPIGNTEGLMQQVQQAGQFGLDLMNSEKRNKMTPDYVLGNMTNLVSVAAMIFGGGVHGYKAIGGMRDMKLDPANRNAMLEKIRQDTPELANPPDGPVAKAAEIASAREASPIKEDPQSVATRISDLQGSLDYAQQHLHTETDPTMKKTLIEQVSAISDEIRNLKEQPRQASSKYDSMTPNQIMQAIFDTAGPGKTIDPELQRAFDERVWPETRASLGLGMGPDISEDEAKMAISNLTGRYPISPEIARAAIEGVRAAADEKLFERGPSAIAPEIQPTTAYPDYYGPSTKVLGSNYQNLEPRPEDFSLNVRPPAISDAAEFARLTPTEVRAALKDTTITPSTIDKMGGAGWIHPDGMAIPMRSSEESVHQEFFSELGINGEHPAQDLMDAGWVKKSTVGGSVGFGVRGLTTRSLDLIDRALYADSKKGLPARGYFVADELTGRPPVEINYQEFAANGFDVAPILARAERNPALYTRPIGGGGPVRGFTKIDPNDIQVGDQVKIVHPMSGPQAGGDWLTITDIEQHDPEEPRTLITESPSGMEWGYSELWAKEAQRPITSKGEISLGTKISGEAGQTGAPSTTSEGRNIPEGAPKGTTFAAALPPVAEGEKPLAVWQTGAEPAGAVPGRRGVDELKAQLKNTIVEALNTTPLSRGDADPRLLQTLIDGVKGEIDKIPARELQRFMEKRSWEVADTFNKFRAKYDPDGYIQHISINRGSTSDAYFHPDQVRTFTFNPDKLLAASWAHVLGDVADGALRRIKNSEWVTPENYGKFDSYIRQWITAKQAELDENMIAEEVFHAYDIDHPKGGVRDAYLRHIYNNTSPEWKDVAARAGLGISDKGTWDGSIFDYLARFMQDPNSVPEIIKNHMFDRIGEYRASSFKVFMKTPLAGYTYRVLEVIPHEIREPGLIEEAAQAIGKEYQTRIRPRLQGWLASDEARNRPATIGVPLSRPAPTAGPEAGTIGAAERGGMAAEPTTAALGGRGPAGADQTGLGVKKPPSEKKGFGSIEEFQASLKELPAESLNELHGAGWPKEARWENFARVLMDPKDRAFPIVKGIFDKLSPRAQRTFMNAGETLARESIITGIKPEPRLKEPAIRGTAVQEELTPEKPEPAKPEEVQAKINDPQFQYIQQQIAEAAVKIREAGPVIDKMMASGEPEWKVNKEKAGLVGLRAFHDALKRGELYQNAVKIGRSAKAQEEIRLEDLSQASSPVPELTITPYNGIYLGKKYADFNGEVAKQIVARLQGNGYHIPKDEAGNLHFSDFLDGLFAEDRIAEKAFKGIPVNFQKYIMAKTGYKGVPKHGKAAKAAVNPETEVAPGTENYINQTDFEGLEKAIAVIPQKGGFAVIRHGSTARNGGAGSAEKLRGQDDVALNEQGQQQAERIAAAFKGVNVSVIYVSPLKRARDTADAISATTGAKVIVDPNLAAWNIGEFAGKPTATHGAILADYAVNRPDEKIPGGESFNDYLRRYLPAVKAHMMDALKQDGITLEVNHTRGARVVKAHIMAGAQGLDINPDPIQTKEEIGPGGIMGLKFENGRWQIAGDYLTNRFTGEREFVSGEASQKFDVPAGKEPVAEQKTSGIQVGDRIWVPMNKIEKGIATDKEAVGTVSRITSDGKLVFTSETAFAGKGNEYTVDPKDVADMRRPAKPTAQKAVAPNPEAKPKTQDLVVTGVEKNIQKVQASEKKAATIKGEATPKVDINVKIDSAVADPSDPKLQRLAVEAQSLRDMLPQAQLKGSAAYEKAKSDYAVALQRFTARMAIAAKDKEEAAKLVAPKVTDQKLFDHTYAIADQLRKKLDKGADVNEVAAEAAKKLGMTLKQAHAKMHDEQWGASHEAKNWAPAYKDLLLGKFGQTVREAKLSNKKIAATLPIDGDAALGSKLPYNPKGTGRATKSLQPPERLKRTPVTTPAIARVLRRSVQKTEGIGKEEAGDLIVKRVTKQVDEEHAANKKKDTKTKRKEVDEIHKEINTPSPDPFASEDEPKQQFDVVAHRKERRKAGLEEPGMKDGDSGSKPPPPKTPGNILSGWSDAYEPARSYEGLSDLADRMDAFVKSLAERVSPGRNADHPIEQAKQWIAKSVGDRYRRDGILKAMHDWLGDDIEMHRSLRRAIEGPEDARNEARKLLEPEEAAFVDMWRGYEDAVGKIKTSSDRELMKSLVEDHLSHILKFNEKGDEVFNEKKDKVNPRGMQSNGVRYWINRAVDKDGNVKFPTIDSLIDKFGEGSVEEDLTKIFKASTNAFINKIRVKEMIDDLSGHYITNDKHFQFKEKAITPGRFGTGRGIEKGMPPYRGRAIVAKGKAYDTMDQEYKDQLRQVNLGPYRTQLSNYFVYKPLADQLERYADLEEGMAGWNKAANVFTKANSIYKLYKFGFNPIHMFNLLTNMDAMSGKYSPIPNFHLYSKIFGRVDKLITGKDVWETPVGTFNGDEAIAKIIDAGAVVRDQVIDSANLGGLQGILARNVPGFTQWHNFMWHGIAWKGQIGLSMHLADVISQQFEDHFGRSPNEAEFNNILRLAVQNSKNAMGFLDRADMSRDWNMLGNSIYFANSWSTLQLRMFGKALDAMHVPGANWMANLGGGEKYTNSMSAMMKDLGKMKPEELKWINSQDAQLAKQFAVGGAMKLLATSTALAYAGSSIAAMTGQPNAQISGPWNNAFRDPTHTFDIYLGTDPATGKDKWQHNPLYGMIQEMALYGLAAVKEAANGGDPVSVVTAPLKRYAFGKVNPVVNMLSDLYAQREISLFWQGYGDKADITQDPSVVAIQKALAAKGINFFPASLMDQLIYSWRSVGPMPSFAPTIRPTDQVNTWGDISNAMGTGQFLGLGDLMNVLDSHSPQFGQLGNFYKFDLSNLAQYVTGSRQTLAATPQQVAQNNQIAQSSADNAAKTQAIQEMTAAAYKGDGKAILAIANQTGMDNNQMLNALTHPPSGSGGGILYHGLPYQPPASSAAQDTIQGITLSPAQTTELEALKKVNTIAMYEQLKATGEWQMSNGTERGAMLSGMETQVMRAVENQYAQQIGIAGGAPITTSDIQGLVQSEIDIRGTTRSTLATNPTYLAADPIEQQRMRTEYASFADTLAWDSTFGSLKGVPPENIQKMIDTTIGAEEGTRDFLKGSIFYQMAQPGQQAAMLTEYSSLARTMAKRFALGQGQGPRGNIQLTPDQILPTIQNVINIEENAKAMLHGLDYYQVADQPTQQALDGKYATLARSLAFSGGGDPATVINNSLMAEESYFALQNQFGGSDYIKLMAQQLSDQELLFRQSADYTPKQIAAMQKVLRAEFLSKNPAYAQYLKAKTWWGRNTADGQIYNSLNNSEYAAVDDIAQADAAAGASSLLTSGTSSDPYFDPASNMGLVDLGSGTLGVAGYDPNQTALDQSVGAGAAIPPVGG